MGNNCLGSSFSEKSL